MTFLFIAGLSRSHTTSIVWSSSTFHNSTNSFLLPKNTISSIVPLGIWVIIFQRKGLENIGNGQLAYSSSARLLRGFLGLRGYYRSFIKVYGKIAKPLIDLLKVALHWSNDADKAFVTLKTEIIELTILKLHKANCR